MAFLLMENNIRNSAAAMLQPPPAPQRMFYASDDVYAPADAQPVAASIKMLRVFYAAPMPAPYADDTATFAVTRRPRWRIFLPG